MKTPIALYVVFLFTATVMKSRCSVIPFKQPSNVSTISPTTKQSSTMYNSSKHNNHLWQPPVETVTVLEEYLMGAVKLLHKRARNLVSTYTTESIPEHPIQTEYLEFVKKILKSSTRQERAVRSPLKPFTYLWTLLRTPGVAKTYHSNANQTKDEPHNLNSTDRTVRTDANADSKIVLKIQSNGQGSDMKMVASPEDLIRWFNIHGEVVKESETNEVAAKEGHEIHHSAEDEDDTEEEVEEPSRADPPSSGLQYSIGMSGPRYNEDTPSSNETNGTEYAESERRYNKIYPPLGSSEERNNGHLSAHIGPTATQRRNSDEGEWIVRNHSGENTFGRFQGGIHQAERSGIPRARDETNPALATFTPSLNPFGYGERDKEYMGQQGAQEVDGMQEEEKTVGGRTEELEEEYIKTTKQDYGDENIVHKGDKGSNQGMMNGQNLTQLSLMAYKIAKAEKVFSMAAAPCREVSAWMPEVVKRLELELPGFQFYCIDMEEPPGSMEDLMEAFGDIPGAFIQSSPDEIEQVIPKNVDLVVSWMGMQRWGIRKSWRFIKGLRRSGARMGLFSNNRMSGNSDPSSQSINIRKSPLLFNDPQRVIGKVSSDENTQLLLYSMAALREGL